MSPHDFRRLALAHDLLQATASAPEPKADPRLQLPPEPRGPEAARTIDNPVATA